VYLYYPPDYSLTEKARREREKERREQYKQVRAHVKKDDGRLQAYGWSLPAKFTGSGGTSSGTSGTPRTATQKVPVPVYCRPLLEDDDHLKVWITDIKWLCGYHNNSYVCCLYSA
jgi:hypothetical protein